MKAETDLAAPRDIERLLVRAFEWVRQLSGWRRYALAFVLGIAAATSMAPYYFLPGIILGLSGLALLLDGAAGTTRPRRIGFLAGWAFGFGYFLFGMYWLGFAFLVQADQFGWMIPIAVPAFTGFLGLFFAMPAALAVSVWRDGVARLLFLAICVSAFEFLRGTILTGLPWNLFGQAFAGTPYLAQLAAWIGPYGLSLLVILFGIAPAALVDQRGHVSWRGPILSLMLFAGMALFSIARLALSPGISDANVAAVIVQPNVAQRDKLDPEKQAEGMRALIALTVEGAAETDAETVYAIWPENAAWSLANDQRVPQFLGQSLPVRVHLITGTIRYDDREGQRSYANSAAYFGHTDAGGEKPLEAVYDKHHLVPFGEYLPLKGLLRALGLAQLAPVEDGFVPGPGPTVIVTAPQPFAPLICYEDVFPRALYPAGKRPRWLVTVTNDAWFGDDAGPKQHLDIARLRAIESGLPMARSANTGISAMIDPYGRITGEIGLYETGVLTRALPAPAARPLYDRLGNWPYFGLLLGLLAIAKREKLARNG